MYVLKKIEWTRKRRQSYRHADPRRQPLQVAQGYAAQLLAMVTNSGAPWRIS